MSHAICFITTYSGTVRILLPIMQEQNFHENLLNQNISELALSEEFKVVTARHGYSTLGDILRMGKAYEMLKHEGFGYRLLFEFTGVLRGNGLGGYLEEPG